MMHMQPMGYGPPPSMRQEVPLLAEQGIQVTSARFIVYQQTYPLGGITTVAPFSIPAKLGGPIVMIVVGVLLLFGGLANESAFSVVFGVFAGGAGIFWMRSCKATHGVMITTAGMNVQALTSQDPAFVGRVVGALNHALSMR